MLKMGGCKSSDGRDDGCSVMTGHSNNFERRGYSTVLLFCFLWPCCKYIMGMCVIVVSQRHCHHRGSDLLWCLLSSLGQGIYHVDMPLLSEWTERLPSQSRWDDKSCSSLILSKDVQEQLLMTVMKKYFRVGRRSLSPHPRYVFL